MKHSYLFRLIVVPILLVTAVLGSQARVVRAIDPPAISVAPVWRPGTTLTSLFAGPGSPDIRYVEAEIYATSSVEYYAMEFTCTVSPSLLGSYTFDDPAAGSYPVTPDSGDDVPMVRLGPDWHADQTLGGAIFVASPLSPTGAITVGISMVNPGGPLGHNGLNTTELVATLRYQVKSQLPAFTSGTSPFNCTTSFLNRDGGVILAANYTAPAPLNVLAGYAIKGNVSYQARAAKAGIGVTCGTPQASSPGAISTTTDMNGNFTVTTRKQSIFNCQFFGNITNPAAGQQDDVYVMAQTWLPMTGLSYTLLSVPLTGGNVDRTPSTPTEHAIDNADIIKVTGNYNVATTFGDANGDGKTDKSDLAIVANNLGAADGITNDHLLFGLARSVSTTGSEDRIWTCDGVACGPVRQIVAGTSRNFWPMLSPDGSKIAFSQSVSSNNHHLLFTIPAAGGTTVQLTPTTPPAGMAWSTQNFAPSWSPDGSKIAYICSWDSDTSGWQFNQGNLCVVDPSGKNLQYITGGAKIYPPAWLDNHTVLFASQDDVSSCPHTICKIDFSTMGGTPNPVPFDAVITGTADMPTVQLGPNTGDRDLFYRSIQGVNAFLVIAAIPISGNLAAFNNTPQFPGLVHAPVGFYDAHNGNAFTHLSDSITYYTSQHFGGRGLVYNDAAHPGGYLSAGFDWAGSTSASPRWGEPGQAFVIGNIGDPYWDGVPTHASALWGERKTMDWEP